MHLPAGQTYPMQGEGSNLVQLIPACDATCQAKGVSRKATHRTYRLRHRADASPNDAFLGQGGGHMA